MKLRFALATRRTFLNTLFWGWFAAFAGGVLYPVVRFLFPELEKEPDQVRLPLAEYGDMAPNSARIFPWGSKMGILVLTEGMKLRGFKGVCTHLDCNVRYLPWQKRFHCPCHQGWFDENGVNIAGPPPSPLHEFFLAIEGPELVVHRVKPSPPEVAS